MNLNSKKDFENLFLRIINPLRNKYSDSGAFLDVGSQMACFSDTVAKFEGFARVLWGLVPFWKGGSDDKEFEEIYLKGIISGTNPGSDEYWGNCADFDQRFVEMAALSYALLLTPDKVWFPLNDEEKERFSSWLYQINDLYVPESNWLFFRILVNVALKKLSMKYSRENLLMDLEYVDSLYVGKGWYKDGVSTPKIPHNGQRDYYNPFAIHFYALIYSMFEDDKYSLKFKERAMEFAKEFIYWFSDSGAGVAYGRSQTYRFAQIAFWSACLLSGNLPYDVGVIKGIIVRNLTYWFEDDKIFDKGGVLTVGYKYNQPSMSEAYNSSASPYWCLKAFAFLSLPSNHIFWRVKPQKMPKLENICCQKNADVISARYGGESVLYPCGTLSSFSGNTMHKYLKFAYSSKFGFSVPKSNWGVSEAAADSTLAFEIGGRVFTRIKNMGHKIYDDRLEIMWSAIEGIDVTTEIIITDYGHKRRHTINSGFDCTGYDAGFSVSALCKDNLSVLEKEHSALVENNTSFCKVSGSEGKGLIIYAAPNTNIISPKTVIPAISYNIKKGINKFETEVINMGM